MGSSSFIVSALKHRPQTFAEVLAQDHVMRTLKHSLERNRIANAYIFSGSRGTGKTTTARIFAKALNCENRQGAEPCNQCDSCRAIMRGVHPDVIEIDAASNTSVNDIRELRENARFTPSQSPYKIYIIDESHMLSNSANNAFLKTLEEPPAHCKFLFATTELHKIPNTILSRCQRFQFRRIPVSVIVNHLKSILTNQTEVKVCEGDELDRILFHISRMAEGVLRDALVLLDQVLAFCSEGLNAAETEEILGVIEIDWLERFCNALFDCDLPGVLSVIDGVSDQGKDVRLFLGECLRHLRNLAVCRITGGDSELLDLPDEFIKQLKATAERAPIEQVLYITDMLWEAERRMAFASDARLILEMYAIKAAKAGQAVRIDDLLKKISSSPGANQPISIPAPAPRPNPAPAPTVSPEPEKPATSSEKEKPAGASDAGSAASAAATAPQETQAERAPVQEENPAREAPQKEGPTAGLLQSTWDQFLHEIESENAFLAGALQDSAPLDITGQNVRIALPAQNAFQLKLLNQPRNSKAMTQFLQRSFGKPLQAIYEIHQDMPTHAGGSNENGNSASPEPSSGANDAKTPGPTRRELRERAEQDPFFSKIAEEFGGRITDITPNR